MTRQSTVSRSSKGFFVTETLGKLWKCSRNRPPCVSSRSETSRIEMSLSLVAVAMARRGKGARRGEGEGQIITRAVKEVGVPVLAYRVRGARFTLRNRAHWMAMGRKSHGQRGPASRDVEGRLVAAELCGIQCKVRQRHTSFECLVPCSGTLIRSFTLASCLHASSQALFQFAVGDSLACENEGSGEGKESMGASITPRALFLD